MEGWQSYIVMYILLVFADIRSIMHRTKFSFHYHQVLQGIQIRIVRHNTLQTVDKHNFDENVE